MLRLLTMIFILTTLNLSAYATTSFSNPFNLSDGSKQDYLKVFKYYQKACDEDSLTGCTNLGVMYNKGIGTKQDYFKAVKFYQKACDGGDSNGCNNLGMMNKDGTGVVNHAV